MNETIPLDVYVPLLLSFVTRCSPSHHRLQLTQQISDLELRDVDIERLQTVLKQTEVLTPGSSGDRIDQDETLMD